MSRGPVAPGARVLVVDPSAYTPVYDGALCAALARRGARVTLATSHFAHAERPAPDGYELAEVFYRRVVSIRDPRLRRVAKLAGHVPDMLALRRRARAEADVVHLQWVPLPWVDVGLLPGRPRVLTVHNAAPRGGGPGEARATRAIIDRMDGLVVHSDHGRQRLLDQGVDGARIHVVPIGALAPGPAGPLPPELVDDGRPVVLMFGLLRPYKGLATLLAAWRGIDDAQLWIVGRPMMAVPPLPPGATLVGRYVSAGESSAVMRRADVIVLPYEADERIDGSGVLADALGAQRATVVSAVGGLAEVAAAGAARAVSPGDPAALHGALAELVGDPAARARLADAARSAAEGAYSWDAAAVATLALYARLMQ